MTTWRSMLGAAAAAALLLPAACGGSGDNSGSSSGGAQAAATPTPAAAPVVTTATATVGGKSETILVDAKGMTLYYFTPDKGGKITCTGSCLAAWPPLTVTGSDVPHSKDVSGSFSTLANPDGKGTQVLYNTWPLYYWVKDQKPGDTTGQGVGGKWFVATPDLASGS